MLSLLLVICVSLPGAAQAQSDEDQIFRVLPRDAIPAIDEPLFEPVATAKAFNNNELMIGLVGNGDEPRAYSTWQLDRHEIVNDTFDGRPVAVTWCPLCGTAIVYERTVAGRTLTFGVSGMLFRDALVMYDRETNTLWSHVDGRALNGPMLGETLQRVPAIHATWTQWKALYPESIVLEKDGRYRSSYEDYNRDPSRISIFGRRMNRSALPPKERILGVRFAGEAMAFVARDLRDAVIVEGEVGNVPIVLAAVDDDLPIVAFERAIGDRILTFSQADSVVPALEDAETQSRWRLSDGEAIDGPLLERFSFRSRASRRGQAFSKSAFPRFSVSTESKNALGERLTRVTADSAFWFGWYGFFPDSGVWTLSR